LLILTTVDLAVGREFSEAIGRLHAVRDRISEDRSVG